MGLDMLGSVIDTRLAHFALFPELPHNLAELVGANLMMPPWKLCMHMDSATMTQPEMAMTKFSLIQLSDELVTLVDSDHYEKLK